MHTDIGLKYTPVHLLLQASKRDWCEQVRSKKGGESGRRVEEVWVRVKWWWWWWYLFGVEGVGGVR